jgi:hypothetical protein
MTNKTYAFLPLFALTLSILLLVPTTGHAGLIEELNAFTDAARLAPAPAAIVNPDVPVPALSKFSAVGRTTGTLGEGACPGSLLHCTSPTDCLSLSFSGTMVSTAPSKSSTLNGCVSYWNTHIDTAGICYDGIGKSTLTAPSGAAVNIAMAGELCIDDEVLPGPTGVTFVAHGSYSVEGGSGPDTNAVGAGDYGLSVAISDLAGGTPYATTGQASFVGAFATH